MRFKGKALCGDVNIPALSDCTSDGDKILWNERPICTVTSNTAHRFFAINNDGSGIERGKLTTAIMNTLARRDEEYQQR